MKNKKILAIALAAAMAVTAIIPGTVANAADDSEWHGALVTVSSKLGGENKLVTSGGYNTPACFVTTGDAISVSSKATSDTIKFTTTNSSASVLPFVVGDAAGSKECTIKAEVTEGDATVTETATIADVEAKDASAEFTVDFEENSSDSVNDVVVKFYVEGYKAYDEYLKKEFPEYYDGQYANAPIAIVKYSQNKTSSSSGGGSGSGSSSGKTTTTTLSDGSKQVTNVVTTATGTITTVTTTKPDGSKTIVKTVKNKDGSGAVTETTITKAGTEKSVEIVMDKTGAVTEVTTTVSNAKGVSAKMSYTASGSKITLAKVETKGKTAITVPATVKCNGKTFKVTKIGAAAVKGNKEIKKVTVGKNVTAIGKNAFKGDSKLKTVVLKGKVTSVGKNAFNGVNKNATFKIAKANFKTVKKAVKNSGVAKTVKYKKA